MELEVTCSNCGNILRPVFVFPPGDEESTLWPCHSCNKIVRVTVHVTITTTAEITGDLYVASKKE